MRAWLVAALLIVSFRPLNAQDSLLLQQKGGALGENLELTLTGEAGRPYWIVFDCEESLFEIAPGVFFYVGFDHLSVSAYLPGFMGYLNGSGTAKATIAIPSDPIVDAETYSFQAVCCDSFDLASNLVRFTPSVVGKCEHTLGPPILPHLGGALVPQADGSVLLIGTTVPVVQSYSSDLEEFALTNLSCVTDLLSASVVLPDGRMLTCGGLGLSGDSAGQPTRRAVLFDPGTGECTELTMNVPRMGHAASLTATGDILISGGFSSFDLTDILTLFQGIENSSEIFDPATLTFITGPDLLEPKAFHTSTTTSAGDVLVAGGLTLIPIVEIPFVSPTGYRYSSSSGQFGLPSFFATGRMLHRATLLQDGRVLLAGGLTIDFTTFLETGNLEDLKLVTLADGELWEKGFFLDFWQTVPGLSEGKLLPAVVALPGTRALVCGGFELLISGADPSQWIFEPKAGVDVYFDEAFSSSGSLNEARIDPLAVPLNDGTVLIVGGGPLSAEIFQD